MNDIVLLVIIGWTLAVAFLAVYTLRYAKGYEDGYNSGEARLRRKLKNQPPCQLHDTDSELYDVRKMVCDTHGTAEQYLSGDHVSEEEA